MNRHLRILLTAEASALLAFAVSALIGGSILGLVASWGEQPSAIVTAMAVLAGFYLWPLSVSIGAPIVIFYGAPMLAVLDLRHASTPPWVLGLALPPALVAGLFGSALFGAIVGLYGLLTAGIALAFFKSLSASDASS